MSRPGSEAASQVRARDDVLGCLLKHAHLALEHRAQAAPDLGVLMVIASGEAQSQQEAAAGLGVDRTSMVALLDALERQGIVARRPSDPSWTYCHALIPVLAPLALSSWPPRGKQETAPAGCRARQLLT